MKSCIRDHDFLPFIDSFDLIFCSETWEKANDDFHLPGYDKVSVPRAQSLSKKTKRGHGGICLFYKCVLKELFVVEKIDDSGFIRLKFLKQYVGKDKDVFICFCYIPPANSPYFMSHDPGYFEQLENDVSFF